MGRAIGIDLGTTNTVIGVLVDGRPRVLEDGKGYKVLPSCIHIKSDGTRIVGQAAHDKIITDPSSTAFAVKRLMGRRYDSPEAAQARKHMPYGIEPAADGSCQLVLGGETLTPTQLSAEFLKAARELAEAALQETVDEAVITVPAYFNHAQRAATIEAARLAGLRCDRLLNEPTAAALAYGFRKDLERTLVIYDLGGGTFDVSVLRLADGVYEILASRGDTFLGGEDFDYRMVHHLADAFQSAHGVDLRSEMLALQRLKDACERAKCELSFTDRTNVLIPRITSSESLEASLTRLTLEGLVEDLVQRTLDVTKKAVSDAGLQYADIDDVILVGGQTRMPRVREAISSLFGMEPSRTVHPEEVVAVGAAVHADSLVNPMEHQHVLLDVTPFDLGIDVAGGLFQAVIPRNSQVPANSARVFATAQDNQESVKVTVRQGDSRFATENEFLGEFVMSGLTPAPRMETKVSITFRIDNNGMLHVSAMEPQTREERTVTVRNYAQVAQGDGNAVPQVTGEGARGPGDPELNVPSVASASSGPRAKAKGVARKSGLLAGLFGGRGGGSKSKGKPAAQASNGAPPPGSSGNQVEDMAAAAALSSAAMAAAMGGGASAAGAPAPASGGAAMGPPPGIAMPSIVPPPPVVPPPEVGGFSPSINLPQGLVPLPNDDAFDDSSVDPILAFADEPSVAPPQSAATIGMAGQALWQGDDDDVEPLGMTAGGVEDADEVFGMPEDSAPLSVAGDDLFSMVDDDDPMSIPHDDLVEFGSDSLPEALAADDLFGESLGADDPFALGGDESVDGRDGGLGSSKPPPPGLVQESVSDFDSDIFALPEDPVSLSRSEADGSVFGESLDASRAGTEQLFGVPEDHLGDSMLGGGPGDNDLFAMPADESVAGESIGLDADFLGELESAPARTGGGYSQTGSMGPMSLPEEDLFSLPADEMEQSALSRSALDESMLSEALDSDLFTAPIHGGGLPRDLERTGGNEAVPVEDLFSMAGEDLISDVMPSKKGDKNEKLFSLTASKSQLASEIGLNALGQSFGSEPGDDLAEEPPAPPTVLPADDDTRLFDRPQSRRKRDRKRRKPAKLKLAYRQVDAMVAEYRENLRRGGCFVKTPKPLPVGRECLIEVRAPGLAEPLRLDGVVTWSSVDQGDLPAGQDPGMGIEYRMDDGRRRQIEQLLADLG